MFQLRGGLYLVTSCIITSLVLHHGSNFHGTSFVSSAQHKQVHGRLDTNTGHYQGALFAGQVGIVSDVATEFNSLSMQFKYQHPYILEAMSVSTSIYSRGEGGAASISPTRF